MTATGVYWSDSVCHWNSIEERDENINNSAVFKPYSQIDVKLLAYFFGYRPNRKNSAHLAVARYRYCDRTATKLSTCSDYGLSNFLQILWSYRLHQDCNALQDKQRITPIGVQGQSPCMVGGSGGFAPLKLTKCMQMRRTFSNKTWTNLV